MGLAVSTQLSFFHVFWEVDKVGNHREKPCATLTGLIHFPLQPLRSDISKKIMTQIQISNVPGKADSCMGQFWLQMMLTLYVIPLKKKLKWYTIKKYKIFGVL